MANNLTLHVHGVATVGKVEATSLSRTVGAEAKGAIGSGSLSHALVSILLIVREVLLNDVVRLHVDLLVGVVLAIVDLLHAAALLDEEGILVEVLGAFTGSLLVEIANLQDVLKAVQSNLNDLVVGANEKVTERLDASLANQIADLVRLLQTARGGVADRPACLLASLEVTVLKEVDQGGDDVGVNDGLDLGRVSGRDVGDGPACLLADTVLGGAEQRQEVRESTTVDDDLGLHVVASHNVTH